MQRFEAYPSAAKLLGLALLNVGMIATSAFCITLPQLQAQIAGWAGVIFFGLTLLAFASRAFQLFHPKIVIDDAGIHTGTSLGLIEWSDITDLRIETIRNTELLSIYVIDKHKYLNRLPYLARKIAEQNPLLGVSEIALSFVGLSPGLNEAWRFLQKNGRDIISLTRGTTLEEWADNVNGRSSP